MSAVIFHIFLKYIVSASQRALYKNNYHSEEISTVNYPTIVCICVLCPTDFMLIFHLEDINKYQYQGVSMYCIHIKRIFNNLMKVILINVRFPNISYFIKYFLTLSTSTHLSLFENTLSLYLVEK